MPSVLRSGYVGTDRRHPARLRVPSRAPCPLRGAQRRYLRRPQARAPDRVGSSSASGAGTWLIVAWVLGSVLTSGISLVWQIKRLGRPHRYSIKGVAGHVRKWFKILILHHLTSLGSVMIPSLMPVPAVIQIVISRCCSFRHCAACFQRLLLDRVGRRVRQPVGRALLRRRADGTEAAQGIWLDRRLLRRFRSIFLAAFGRWVLGIFGPTYAAQSYGISSDFRCRGCTRRSDQRLCHSCASRVSLTKPKQWYLAMAAVALGGARSLMVFRSCRCRLGMGTLSGRRLRIFAVDALVEEEKPAASPIPIGMYGRRPRAVRRASVNETPSRGRDG